MKVACLLSNNFEELEAVGTIALLGRAGITIDIYSLHQHQATGRFQLTFDKLLNIKELNHDDYEALFIPGGPHFVELEENEQVKEIIQYFFHANKIVSAICAAPTILGHMGFLKGKKYTCFTSMNEDFGGTYLGQYAVVDGNLITGRSAAASIDFAFALIEKLSGKEKADEIKRSIYY